MAEIVLKPAPLLGGVDITRAGCRLVERDELELVALAVPQGGEAAVAEALASGFGLAMPAMGGSEERDGVRVLHAGPDLLMLVLEGPNTDAERQVATRTGGAGYATLQTDGWVRLELSGPATRAALERVCMLDLDDSAFPVGAAARTVMEHLSVILLRTGADCYLLLSASSSGRSFLHALETTLAYIED